MPTSNHPNSRAQRPLPTLALTGLVLALGVPLAIVAIILERVFVRDVVLGSKTINTGPDSTKTLSFSLLTGPGDAVNAAASISIICSITLILGMWIVRHFSGRNIWGWMLIVPGIANVLGQMGCLAGAFILQAKNGEAKSADEVTFVGGKYITGGKLYTRDAWACMMDKYFHEREGDWAGKACSDLRTGRILIIPMLLCSLVLASLALWQVQRRGGIRWLLHGVGKHSNKPESIGL
ncbi:hypothetical protein EJ04DRAFT_507527 [Polyplosphaeria fusca]|uniref:Uncharacterized protein n=1 Tax=Polyplosphaeria fusca TaxID=682080 RepID=A0A9P4RAE6_9PLEO|nr:hypothetical protein EJ04DRAFT_507527 [Polyplosphaeria fusca]